MKVDTTIKQVAIINKSKFKDTQDLVVNCATGFLNCAERARINNPQWYYKWMDGGFMKVVLKMPPDGMIVVADKIDIYNNDGIIVLGPAPSEHIDKITKGLKLL